MLSRQWSSSAVSIEPVRLRRSYTPRARARRSHVAPSTYRIQSRNLIFMRVCCNARRISHGAANTGRRGSFLLCPQSTTAMHASPTRQSGALAFLRGLIAVRRIRDKCMCPRLGNKTCQEGRSSRSHRGVRTLFHTPYHVWKDVRCNLLYKTSLPSSSD